MVGCTNVTKALEQFDKFVKCKDTIGIVKLFVYQKEVYDQVEENYLLLPPYHLPPLPPALPCPC